MDKGDGGSDADPVEAARAVCLRLLTGRARTRLELETALRRRGVSDAAAAEALDRLVGVGLVDDEAFAQAWVGSRHVGRGLAGRALAHELRQRGVAPGTVEQAVATVGPAEEVTRAQALVARRLPTTSGLDPTVRARRLAGMLARKGYPGALAARVVREALIAEGDEVALTDGEVD